MGVVSGGRRRRTHWTEREEGAEPPITLPLAFDQLEVDRKYYLISRIEYTTGTKTIQYQGVLVSKEGDMLKFKCVSKGAKSTMIFSRNLVEDGRLVVSTLETVKKRQRRESHIEHKSTLAK